MEIVKIEAFGTMNGLQQCLGEELEGQVRWIWGSQTLLEQNARRVVVEGRWYWWKKWQWRI